MAEVETKRDATQGRPSGKAQWWLDEIHRAGKREKDWRQEGMEVVRRYRKETAQGELSKKRGFNILWANTELLKPAILSRTPQPDVRRRFRDEAPVARVASQVLERALKFVADDPEYDFAGTLEQSRDDLLLPGRGVLRVVYERDIRKRRLFEVEGEDETGLPETQFQADDGRVLEPDSFDDEGRAFREDITNQETYMQYVYWEDYREGDARTWDHVPWVAYRHLMIRKELTKAFGEVGKAVPVGKGLNEENRTLEDDPDSPIKQAIVWEVWDKTEEKRVWVAENYAEALLDEEDDPLGLEGFFPQPNPLYAITTTDTRVPVPEFRIYRDQADELDRISLRIKNLIDALKVRGAYAAAMKEMADILDGEENDLIPIEQWPELQDMGGLDKAVMWIPIDQIAKVLVGLYEQRDRLKAEIFELTGLSDILRGSTDPRETKGAQTLKAQFGTIRLNPRQKPMEEFARGCFELMAEIMAEHFTADTLLRMTGLEIEPEMMAQVMQMLRDDKIREFSIDIETDTTVAPDEAQDQARISEFMRATTEFIAQAGQLTAANPALAPLLFEIYKAAARRFKLGRELEDQIEQASTATLQALQNASEQPDPEAQAAQAEQQRKDAEAQADMQRKAQEQQAELLLAVQELQAKMQLQERELEGKLALKAAEIAGNQRLQEQQAASQNGQVQ